MIQHSLIEKDLPCELTDAEVQSRGRMLSETIWAIDATNAARSETMKEFKDRLTGLNETQRKLAQAIQSRVEKRIVQCAQKFHVPVEGRKRVTRLDTGEVVLESAMTDAEKQLNLFPG